ncbi:hypothetical protein QBC35DRAFT_252025 [Podospora australis]|uniref:Uncharacterized protein n=1 Tax=Podospora australis TaxID=1536484 RepID=A0AAN7AH22_9PEZI|nr:hypothetical protein QBC35DRAFT_252025 [Podospora australis]
MLLSAGHWVACVACVAILSQASATPITPNETAALANGFDIFNAVHSALRQWGSSLNHNGLSLFLATVPEGVTLHHGTGQATPPPGPEWLAFDIEHSEMFAHPRMPYPPRAQKLLAHYHPRFQQQVQIGNDSEAHGYLHIYRTTKPLSLLYLDGMSAGNTAMGTLDTQDLLLRGARSADIWDERGRARDICDIVTSWGLQGVIRMEAGFEIIKCNFSDSLELVSVNRRPEMSDPGSTGYRNVQALEFVRALSKRYNGLGASKVALDFSSMVSAMFFDVNITNPNPERQYLRRLSSVTDEELGDIRSWLKQTVHDRLEERPTVIDWQGVTDSIIGRYADRLWYMAEKISDLNLMRGEINLLLNTHIDYAAHDERYESAKERCTEHYIRRIQPSTQGDRMILAAIKSVTHSICSILFTVRELIVEDPNADEGSLVSSKRLLKSLNARLRWTRWKECNGCGFGEVCFLPMWPFGDKDSFERPNCRNVTTVTNGWWDKNRYWDSPRFDPPGKPKTGHIADSEHDAEYDTEPRDL